MCRGKRISLILLFLAGSALPAWPRPGPARCCSEKDLRLFLHRKAGPAALSPVSPTAGQIQDGLAPVPISPRQACCFAIERLQARSVRRIQICEVLWIAAPLGGYLVDLKGRWTFDGEEFSLFRIGIRDGSEASGGPHLAAGIEFVFIAKGKTASGESRWFPRPGPDYRITGDETWPESFFAWEFLLNREKFETLGDRYQ